MKNEKTVNQEVSNEREEASEMEVAVERDMTIEVVVGNKSNRMVQLWVAGYTVAQISKKLAAHYSFVYGVIQRHEGGVVPSKKEPAKSDLFRSMYDEGSTVGEIAKQTNSNYSYVFSVIKKYRESK